MKNSLKYLKLWQKKRAEMNVSDDPQQDWAQMQGLLNKHMPTTNLPGKGRLSHWAHITHLKLISALIITISAATIVYFTAQKDKTHDSNHHFKTGTQKDSTATNNDSLSNKQLNSSIKTDSHNETDSNSNAVNSTSALKSGAAKSVAGKGGLVKDSLVGTAQIQTIAKQNGAILKTAVGKSAANGLSATPNNIQNTAVNSKRNSVGNQKQLSSNGLTASGKTSGNNLQVLKGGKKSRTISGVVYRNQNSNKVIYASSTSGKSSKYAGTLSNNSHYNSNATNSISKLNINSYQYQSTDQTALNQAAAGENQYPPSARVDKNSPDFFIRLTPPNPGFNQIAPKPSTIAASGMSKIIPGTNKSKPYKNKENAKGANSNPSKIEWGILTGINTSGSFTSKSQNSNFYGSSPVDVFFGSFATYPVKEKWAIGTQVKVFSPQAVSGSYNYTNTTKVDSGASFKITDKRKYYAIEVPVTAMYKITDNLSIKAGPVFNFPVKQVKGIYALSSPVTKADSAYYSTAKGTVDSTKYSPKFGYGITAGVSLRVKRFIIEATYLKGLNGSKVSSGLGSYNGQVNTLQFTIGFQLSKPKH